MVRYAMIHIDDQEGTLIIRTTDAAAIKKHTRKALKMSMKVDYFSPRFKINYSAQLRILLDKMMGNSECTKRS